MRVLVASIVDPGVALGGAWTATRGLLDMLGRHAPFTEIDVVALPLRSRASHAARRAVSAARACFGPWPAKAHFAADPHMRERVRASFATRRHDLVLLNGADLLGLLPVLPAGMPAMLVAHNIEHRLQADQVRRLARRWPFARPLLRRDLARLRAWELDGMRAVGNVMFLSQADAVFARRELPGLNAITVPPVFDAARRPRAHPSDRRGLHIGLMANFAWWPNREGVQWLVDRVLPPLRDRVTLHLFGRDDDRVVPHARGVLRHGFVPTPAVAFDECDFMVCPIAAGGGVCVKAAEALYHRVPLLSTSFGVRGLPLLPDPAVVILDRASDWSAFLASERAESLGSLDVSSTCSDAFLASAHAGVLGAFVARVLASSRETVARNPWTTTASAAGA